MPADEKSSKHHDESDSEEEEEVEVIPKVDIDVTKLTPLSPEVISKQVSLGIPFRFFVPFLRNTLRLRSTLVRTRSSFAASTMRSLIFPSRAGTIGHVAHGKSTVVKAISGVMTVRFKNELVRNITIKLGYANAKVRLHSFSALVSSTLLQCVRHRDTRALPDESAYRFTSAKTRLVLDRGITARTAQTRRTARRASDRAADTE